MSTAPNARDIRIVLATKKVGYVYAQRGCYRHERSNSSGLARLHTLPLANRNAGTMGRLFLRDPKLAPSRLAPSGLKPYKIVMIRSRQAGTESLISMVS
jgi:hypothetical protein